MYDSKPGWWIARELGMRIGLPEFFPWKDSIEYAKTRLESGGYDCDALQRDGVILGEPGPLYYEEGAAPEFYTESGKIELYSNALASHGFDAMPTYHDDEIDFALGEEAQGDKHNPAPFKPLFIERSRLFF